MWSNAELLYNIPKNDVANKYAFGKVKRLSIDFSIALLEAVKESIWIQRFLKELGRNVDDGDVIMEDNQGTIALSQNPEYHARTKHIDVQYHFVRECIEMGQIQLRYCPTEDMVADALTKPLARDRFEKLVKEMGLETMDEFKSGSDGNDLEPGHGTR